MELQRFVEVGLRRWPIVLLAFVMTTALTLSLVLPVTRTYKSSGSFVVRPRSVVGEDASRAFDALVRGPEINATYASIARSDVVRDRAERQLTPRTDTGGLRVGAEVVTGTNTLWISVRGGDPQVVRDLAVAIGTATVQYVDELGETYELVPLDAPNLPKHPETSHTSLTVAVGGVFGVLLGFVLASFFEFIAGAWRTARNPGDEPPDDSSPIVPPEPGSGDGSAHRNGSESPSVVMDWVEVDATNASDLLDQVSRESNVRAVIESRISRGRPFLFGVIRAAQLGRSLRVSQGSADASVHWALRRDASQLARRLRAWGRDYDGELIPVDDETIAVVIPHVNAMCASRLLVDFAAIASLLDAKRGGRAWGLEMSIGVRRAEGPASAATEGPLRDRESRAHVGIATGTCS